MFHTMWWDYVSGDRIFQTTQEERVVLEAVEALFWVGQIGVPDQDSIPEIMGMRQGISVAELTSPARRQWKEQAGKVAQRQDQSQIKKGSLYPAIPHLETPVPVPIVQGKRRSLIHLLVDKVSSLLWYQEIEVDPPLDQVRDQPRLQTWRRH